MPRDEIDAPANAGAMVPHIYGNDPEVTPAPKPKPVRAGA